MSIGKTGHVLVRTSHSRGQLKGQRFQSSKSAMSGGLKLGYPAFLFYSPKNECPRTGALSVGVSGVDQATEIRPATTGSPPKRKMLSCGTVEGRRVEAPFDAGLVTSDAGALLLGATIGRSE
jgi:hypothetical protein